LRVSAAPSTRPSCGASWVYYRRRERT
jgi:hypothetical protein